MKFGDAVKHLRSELGLTQVELAMGLHLNAITVGRWENGKTVPTRSITALLLDYAAAKGASERCLDMLTRAAGDAARCRLSFSNEGQYAVEYDALKQLIDDSATPIIICDAKTDEILYLNKKAGESLGAEGSAVGKKCYECLMHSDAPCRKANPAHGEHGSCDACRSFDGAAYRVQEKSIQWNGREAQLKYFLRNEAETGQPTLATGATAAQFKAIFENINGGISVVVYEDDGTLQTAYANDRYYKLFGYTKEQFLEELKDPHNRVHPDDWESAAAAVDRVKATKQPATFRYRIIKRDKSIAHIRCSSSVTVIDGVRGYALISILTDITESVQLEQQALISGQRLSAIMKNMNSAVTASIIKEDGTELLFCNDLYYEMFGYTEEQFHTEVHDLCALAHPDDMAAIRSAALSLNRIGDSQELIYRVITRDGTIKWLRAHVSIMTFPDADGPVQLAIYSDVTDIANAREKLAAQHDRINELLNDTPSGIAIIEVDCGDTPATMRTTYYNDRFISYSGYDRDEYDAMRKDNEMAFVFDEDVHILTADLEKLCAGEIGASVDSMVRCYRKGGGYRWLLLTGQLTERRGNICVINVAMMDITERQEAADRQRISDEMLRIAAEADQRAMIIYDVKNNFCRVESRLLYSAKYGQTFENVPQSLIDLGVVAEDSTDELRTLFTRIRSGEKEFRISLQMHSSPDKYEWFECNTVTVFDNEGSPDHAILVFHNIMEQRMKEAVFKKWQQSIAARPPESYTLFRCNLSRDASLDEQAGSLIDIPFPADAMSFNSRTKHHAEELVYPDDREKYIRMLDSDLLIAMFHRGEHYATLEYRETAENGEAEWRRLTVETVEYPHSTDIQAFLMYEDIDKEKKAELAARELAETDPLTGTLRRGAFAAKVNEIISETPDSHCALIMLDLDGLKRLNDAAGDHALQEVAAVLRSYVRSDNLVCRLGGDEFLVWLRDIPYDAVTGKITQQMCEQICKAYSQEVLLSASAGIAVYPRDGRSYDELYPSADRALYKAKQAGKGSYAFFSVVGEEQAAGVSEASSEAVKTPGTPHGMKHRLLIADDNETNRAILKNIFKDEYLIETAKNGAEAMTSLQHFGTSISVVLLDLLMPIVDGYAVLRRMRNDANLRTIPTIVVTGDEDHATLIKAFELGAAEYVTKPVDVDIIRMRVKAVIGKAENERLRAQNSYLTLQRDEEAKYRTVLESTGTSVVEYDRHNSLFIYDNEISKHIAGNFDHRGLWQVLLSDMVADGSDVKTMQDALTNLADNTEQSRYSKLVKLKTPEGVRHWFRMSIYKNSDDSGLAERLILTFNDVHDEVLANDKLLFQATRDELTGLYNRAGFFEKAAELIAAHEPGYYVMACIDIEKFKVINDQYGTKKGDEILVKFANGLSKVHNGDNGICCRIMADNFAVLYPAQMIGMKVLEDSHSTVAHIDETVPTIHFSVGRCIVDNKSLDVSAIYDRASIARSTVKGRYDTHIATYDESMRASILRQQEITAQMNQALTNGQFEVWLQPQFNHATGMLSGAEALVRWRHPEDGLIPPGEFIPIFERNGFIYELDKHVWEQTCILLRKWLDQGLDPVPVSVNVSRYDVFRDDIIGIIEGLVAKYELPIELLRLEITESAFSESAEQIIKVVETLVEKGFTVEIDDFGSGYSSLNTLKDVPAQILKMDMRFLENDRNVQRGGSIIESIVRMAKWLGMSVIAEGVETIEQADYLKSIGCTYIQGYLYSRPAQATEYEKLFADGKIEPKLRTVSSVETWNSNAFWNPASMETLIFNSYVGGACIFEYCGGKTEMLRYNDQYISELHGIVTEDEQLHDVSIVSYIDERGREALTGALREALRNDREGSCEIRLTKGEQTEYVRMTCRVIAKTTDRTLYYCVIQNLTEQHRLEREREESAERLSAIMENIDGGISATVFTDENNVEIVFANDGFYKLFGYTKEQFEAELPNPIEPILPADRKKTMATVARIVRERGSETYEYRCKKRDGSVVWIQTTNTVISLAGIGDIVLLAVTTDVTALRRAEEQRLETADRLGAVMNAMINGVTALTISGKKVEFLFANDRYYQLHGIGQKGSTAEVLRDALSMIHIDDRERIRDIVMSTEKVGQSVHVKYRINLPDGTLRNMKAEITVTNLIGVDTPVQVAIYSDITDETKAGEQLCFLNESASEILAQPDSEKAINDALRKLLEYFAGERSYIFELDDAAQTSDNTYELCAPGVTPEIGRLKNLPYETQQYWFDAFGREGFIAIPDVAAIDDSEAEMRELLLSQNIRSIIVAPLWRDGRLIGYLGVDNPAEAVDQVSQLIALADYFAVLLTRRDLTKTVESERRTVQQLMDDTPGGFCRMQIFKDKNPTVISFNAGFSEMLGMTGDEVMATYGDDAFKCLVAGDVVAVADEAAAAIRACGRYSQKCRLKKKDGQLIWVQVFGRAVSADSGERFINAYFTDITAQQSIEQMQSELLENLPAGAALYEYDGEKLRVIHINKHYWELVGRSALSAEEISVFGVFHPEDRAVVEDELRSAIRQGRNAGCIARILCGDGSYKPFSVSTNNVRETNGNYLLYTTFTRISDEELAIQKMLPVALSTIVSNTDAMSYVKDKELRYICVSQAVAEIAGATSPRDLIGKTAGEVFEPAFAEKFEEDDRHIIETGEPVVRALEHIPTKDGSVCLAQTTKFPILDAGGNAIGVYCVSHDVTAQKEKESQLKLLTDTIPGGLAAYSISNEGITTLYFNDGYYVYSGYTREEYVALTENEPLALILQEDRHILRSMLHDFASKQEDGMTGACTYRCRTKGGDIRWMSLKATLSRVGDDVNVLNAVQLDITERMNAEKRQSELLDNLPFGAAMYEFDGKTLNAIHINKQYNQMVDREVDISPAGFTPMDAIHPEDRRPVFDEIRSAIAENRNAACDIRLLYGRDEYRLFHLDARIVPGDNGKYLLYVAYERITDRDKELKETSEQLKLLSDSIPGGIATFRCMTGVIEPVYFNDGICKLTGYLREEFDSGSVSVLGLVFDEDMHIIKKQFAILISGETALDCSVRIHTKGGGYKWVECMASVTSREGENVFVVSAVLTDVTEQQEERERLRVSEELNRLAIDQSGKIIARYDVEARTLTLPDTLPEIFEIPKVLENVPDGQIGLGRISADTVGIYCDVFARINSGEVSGEAVYQRNSTLGWRWLKSQFTTVFTNDGKPVSAVISFEDITEQREKEAVYTRWQNAMAERAEDSYTIVRCNLNKSNIMDSWEGTLLSVRFADPAQPFNSRTAEYTEHFVYADDREAFSTFLNSDTMLAEYHRGHRSDSIDYRECGEDGSVRWLRLTVDLVEYPDSTDVEAYLLFENIDEQKHAELSAIRRAETDPLTGVLNRTAFAERVKQAIDRFGPQAQHALFMLDVDGFKQVNDVFGHGAGDQTLIDIADALTRFCRRDDLVGRLGGDEFFAFITNIGSVDTAEKKARLICDMTRKALSVDVHVSVSIGIALLPQDGVDFETLYQAADEALYRTKNAGKDGYCLSSANPVIGTGAKWRGNKAAAQTEPGQKQKIRRILIVDDNEIAQAVLEDILKKDYYVEKAMDGASALSMLHHYGTAISAVLLDLMMPGMSGFEVLEKMRQDERTCTIPVIVVSADEDRATALKVIRAGASDLITKPVDADLLRIRVESAVSKSENERLRAQNSYLAILNTEVNSYRAALIRTGTIVVMLDCGSHEFAYSPIIAEKLAGQYNDRPLWDILIADKVTDAQTVQKMQQLVQEVADDRDSTQGSMRVRLKTVSGRCRLFEMDVFKELNDHGLAAKMILTLKEAAAQKDD